MSFPAPRRRRRAHVGEWRRRWGRGLRRTPHLGLLGKLEVMEVLLPWQPVRVGNPVMIARVGRAGVPVRLAGVHVVLLQLEEVGLLLLLEGKLLSVEAGLQLDLREHGVVLTPADAATMGHPDLDGVLRADT